MRTSFLLAIVLMFIGFVLTTMWLMVGCHVPWWHTLMGLPCFAGAFQLALRERQQLAKGESRLGPVAMTLLTGALLAANLMLSTAALASDLRRYGTAFRADCGDVGTQQMTACR